MSKTRSKKKSRVQERLRIGIPPISSPTVNYPMPKSRYRGPSRLLCICDFWEPDGQQQKFCELRITNSGASTTWAFQKKNCNPQQHYSIANALQTQSAIFRLHRNRYSFYFRLVVLPKSLTTISLSTYMYVIQYFSISFLLWENLACFSLLFFFCKTK